MRLVKITSFSLLLLLFGCASINAPLPSLIDEKPVVKIGSDKIPSSDHIVFIPANVEFPVEFSVTGSLFNKPAKTMVMVSFKGDLYLYKYWASRDGRTWINSHKLLNVEPSGGFDASGGKVGVKLEAAR